MSGRKRHTESLDFMRTFIVAERRGYWTDLFGAGYREMVDKLIKRGWIKRERGPAHGLGSWRPIMQRNNSLRSTAKGRRAVYRVDRHADPVLRPHSWGTHHGWGNRQRMLEDHDRRLERLARTSAMARNLHPNAGTKA